MRNLFFLLFGVLFLFGCGNTSQTSPAKTAPAQRIVDGVVMHPDYENIPLADLGITVVNPTGWTDDQMNFHLNYCMQTMQSIEEIVHLDFCVCFLEKIQYYYEPKFFKEAYDDQKTWNKDCFDAAHL